MYIDKVTDPILFTRKVPHAPVLIAPHLETLFIVIIFTEDLNCITALGERVFRRLRIDMVN